MKVKELIDILGKLPQHKQVALFWDGSPRGNVEGIVDDDEEVVLVGEWSIYRDGRSRAYEEEKIVFSEP